MNGGGPKHSAQMVVDGVNYLSETVYSIGSQPTKLVGNWIADKIAPSYWRQNFEIIVSGNINTTCSFFHDTDFCSFCSLLFMQHCHACKTNFERTGLHKHHCRGCGEGFCSPCSSNSIPVPARGWATPVRVCNSCFDILSRQKDACPGIIYIHSVDCSKLICKFEKNNQPMLSNFLKQRCCLIDHRALQFPHR